MSQFTYGNANLDVALFIVKKGGQKNHLKIGAHSGKGKQTA